MTTTTRIEITGRTRIGFGWVAYQSETVDGPNQSYTMRQLERGEHIDDGTKRLMQKCAYFLGDRRISEFIFREYDNESGLSHEFVSPTPDCEHGSCVAVVLP